MITLDQLMELVKEVEITDPIDWSDLNISEDDANKLVGMGVLRLYNTEWSHLTPSAVSQKFKDFKEVELPLYFPETVDEWRNDVIKFMQIALWKGVRRMANSIETIDER